MPEAPAGYGPVPAPPGPNGYPPAPYVPAGWTPPPAGHVPGPAGPYPYSAPGYPPGAWAPGYGWPPAPVALPPGYGPPTAPPVAGVWPRDASWMAFDPSRPPPRWGMPDILLAIVAFFVGAFVGPLAVIAVCAPLGTTPSVGVVTIASLAGSWVGSLGFLVLISRVKGQRSLRRDFGLSFSAWDPLIGVGAALVTLLLSAIVQAVVAAALGGEAASNAEAIFGEVKSNRITLVLMALMATIGAPLVEEIVFRGLALRAIERRLGAVAGVVGSSLLFAVLHVQGGSLAGIVSLVAAILVYGLVFAALTRWSGRLGPSVFTHLVINGLSSAMLLYSVFTGAPTG